MRMRKHPRHKQQGQIIVAVPIALLAFIGMVTLVVDIGTVKLLQSEMQNAADAAALAGVWYDPVCPLSYTTCASDNAAMVAAAAAQTPRAMAAEKVAIDYASVHNGALLKILCGSQPDVSPQNKTLNVPRVNALTVVIHCQAGFLSGSVLGVGPIDIWATGTAAIGEDIGNKVMGNWPTQPSLTLVGRLVP